MNTSLNFAENFFRRAYRIWLVVVLIIVICGAIFIGLRQKRPAKNITNIPPDHAFIPVKSISALPPLLSTGKSAFVSPGITNNKSVTGEVAWEQLRREGQYESLSTAFQAARYAAEKIDPLGSHSRGAEFFAANPAHQLRAWFSTDGIELASGRAARVAATPPSQERANVAPPHGASPCASVPLVAPATLMKSPRQRCAPKAAASK